MSKTTRILVLYDSLNGHTENMAYAIASGVHGHNHAEAILRSVPPIRAINEAHPPEVFLAKSQRVDLSEIAHYDGLILGCPISFGNMSAAMKSFIDQTGTHWFSGTMVNKPFSLFASQTENCPGDETALLSMMLPFIHHGMLHVGVTQNIKQTNTKHPHTSSCGLHLINQTDHALSQEETTMCSKLGAPLTRIASELG